VYDRSIEATTAKTSLIRPFVSIKDPTCDRQTRRTDGQTQVIANTGASKASLWVKMWPAADNNVLVSIVLVVKGNRVQLGVRPTCQTW